MCERWLNSFANFLADMGPRLPGTSIDRLDNEKGYEPGNCRWATRIEQARNKRNNRILEWRGEKHFTWELADRFGLKLRVVHDRLRRGWTVAETLTRPIGSYRRRTGEANPQSKLTAEQVAAIKAEYSSGKTSQRKLAQKYSVKQNAIFVITSGKGWKNV